MNDDAAEIKRPWQELEPTDQTDPVEHNVQSSLQHLNWRVLAASIRGKMHGHCGQWRDDSFAVAAADSWTILAVADGAGSAAQSRIGSRIATETVVGLLVERLKVIEPQYIFSAENFSCPMEEDVKRCLVDGFLAAREKIREEAAKRQHSEQDFATTLLAVVQSRHQDHDLIFWISVGDCVAAVFHQDAGCRILSDEDHGTAAGETRFITSPGVETSLQSRAQWIAVRSPIRALALMTDGVAEDFFPVKKRLSELLDGNPIGNGKMILQDGQPLKGILHYTSSNASNVNTLMSWLKYDKQDSFDDRTIVLALDGKD